MSNTILFVFEGKTIEGQIFESIKKYFFSPPKSETPIIRFVFDAEIYQLWKIVKDDPYLEIVEILKERPDSGIGDLKRKDVSEIHLFFDHDAHSHADTMTPEDYHKLIGGMLDTFNNENDERGKLWISYPMAEALKHCKNNPCDCFCDTLLNITDNINYKKNIDDYSDFKDIRKFDLSSWYYLSAVNIERTFCLVNDAYGTFFDYSQIKHWFEQEPSIAKQIQEKQYEKFIHPKNEVVALSPFPLFLLSYFGNSFFLGCKFDEFLKSCSFFCYQKSSTCKH